MEFPILEQFVLEFLHDSSSREVCDPGPGMVEALLSPCWWEGSGGAGSGGLWRGGPWYLRESWPDIHTLEGRTNTPDIARFVP